MTKIFVGSLAWPTTSSDLRDHFAQFSPTDAEVILDRETGRSRGFGYVTVESDEVRDAAIAQLDNTELNGRTIKVDVASDHTPSDGVGFRQRSGGSYGS
jgi:RNA recognition motif-containing protein